MEAEGLDEVPMTFRRQQSTVRHTEVRGPGLNNVGFPACGAGAAGIVLPRHALRWGQKQQVVGKSLGLTKRAEGYQERGRVSTSVEDGL